MVTVDVTENPCWSLLKGVAAANVDALDSSESDVFDDNESSELSDISLPQTLWPCLWKMKYRYTLSISNIPIACPWAIGLFGGFW